jgi:hypothetical protein
MITDEQNDIGFQPDAPEAQTPFNAPPDTKQGDNTAAMDEAAKEASMMLLDRLLGEEKAAEENATNTPPKAEEKAKPSKKAEKKVEFKETVKQEVKSEDPNEVPEDEKFVPTPRRNRITAEKVAEVASRAAAEAAAETYRQIEDQKRVHAERTAQEAAKASEVSIPEDAKEDVERLLEVQRLHPNDYRGRDLAREFLEGAKNERNYEKKWRKENPGVDFSWDDHDHKLFIDNNSIEVTEKHLKEADRSILKEQAITEAEERITKRYGNEIDEIRRSKAEAQLAPIRRELDDASSKSLLAAVRPDLVDMYDSDRAKALADIKSDPIAMEAVSIVEEWSIPALDAAVRVINNPSGYSNKSREVQTLVNAAMRVENILKSVPRDERPVTEDGRRFATMNDFANMPTSQRSRHYTIQDESLVPQLIIKTATYEASRIKSDIERKAESYAKRMGFTKSASESSPKATVKSTPSQSAPSVKAQPTGRKDEKAEETSFNGIPKGFWDSIGLPV